MLKEPPDRIFRIRSYTVTPTTWVIFDERADMSTVAANFAAYKNREVRVTLRFNFEVNFLIFANQPSLVQKPFTQLLNLLLLQILDAFENLHI
jgi:hypothetical protein